MKIANDTVVQFSYLLSEAGQELEKSDQQVPMTYLHGHNNILKGLENELDGKQAGDRFSVTLAPADAYGEIRSGAEQRIPVKHLQGAKKWKKGMIATVQTEKGQQKVTVVKMGKFMVTVDFNHPFAGKTLTFDVEIVNVREASNEEIAHKHAHGVGGHQH